MIFYIFGSGGPLLLFVYLIHPLNSELELSFSCAQRFFFACLSEGHIPSLLVSTWLLLGYFMVLVLLAYLLLDYFQVLDLLAALL